MHYSLNFEVNALKSSKESTEVATGLPEPPVESRLKQMVTKALQEEASLPIDLDTLHFDPGRRRRCLSQKNLEGWNPSHANSQLV